MRGTNEERIRFPNAHKPSAFGAPGNPTDVEIRSFTWMDWAAVVAFLGVFAFTQYLRFRVAASLFSRG